MSQATGSLMVSAARFTVINSFIWQHLPTPMPSGTAHDWVCLTMIMSSIVAMLCYFWLIRRLACITVSLSNVITPVIALILSATSTS